MNDQDDYPNSGHPKISGEHSDAIGFAVVAFFAIFLCLVVWASSKATQ